MRVLIISSMFGKIISFPPIVLGTIMASLFTLLSLSVDVSAQDAPDYLLGNLTLERNLTKEQRQEIAEEVTEHLNSMKKEADGNVTKLNVLLIEDLANRNIIDANGKDNLLSFISSLPKSDIETLPGMVPENVTIPGNVTSPGNNTEFLKELEATSTMIDEIAINNTDSQPVSLITDIIKKRVSDIETFVSGNGTDTGVGPVTFGIGSDETWASVGKSMTCALVGAALPGAGTAYAAQYYCMGLII
jgi:hypothetical protein